jgi:ribonuclease HI
MAYTRHKRTDFRVTLQTDIAADLDFQILEIIQRPHPSTLVVNLYNKKGNNGSYTLDRLMQTDVPQDIPAIYTGDWNLHHADWSMDQTSHGRATQAKNWLSAQGLNLLNTPCTPTWQNKAGTQQSVIDLTFTNERIADLGSVTNWKVRHDITYGSDHFAITWDLDHGDASIPHSHHNPRFNTKHTDPKKWQRTFGDELTSRSHAFQCLQNADLSVNQIETAATAYQDTLTAATRHTAKEARPSEHAKPWWTPALSKQLQLVHQWRAKEKQEASLHGKIDTLTKCASKSANNKFRHLCRTEKQAWANMIISETQRNDIWNLRNWSKGTHRYPSPPISRGPQLPKAVYHQDKVDALRHELLPQPPDLPEVPDTDFTARANNEIPWISFSSTEVLNALQSTNPRKAPGPSQIGFDILRWAWEANSDIFTSLLTACANHGYHPQIWRQSIAIALRKPNKPDYSEPRAYRFIQLLECLGKILEKMMATRLSHYINTHKLVSAMQFGARPGSSTTDASLTFIHDIEAARNHGYPTTALTFDIKGFFDFVNHRRLLHIMKTSGILLEMIKWTSHFLANRQAAILLDVQISPPAPVANGLPQGSPFSGPASILYTADILSYMEHIAQLERHPNAPTPNHLSPTTLAMYVDDSNIWVSSDSLDTNIKILQSAYTAIGKRLRAAGLCTDVAKCELIHFTRRHRDRNHLPSITIPKDNGTGNVTIQPSQTIRWLGIWFDAHLNFHEHVRRVTDKAARAVNGLRILGNSIRGLAPSHFHTLYLQAIRPIMDYAAPVWHSGTASQIKPMTIVQNNALRLICGAFRTSPAYALEIEAAVPPLDIFLRLTKHRAAIRFHKLATHSPIKQRLPPTWRHGLPANPPPPRTAAPATRTRTPKSTKLCTLAELTTSSAERTKPDSPPWAKTARDLAPPLQVTTQPKHTRKRKQTAAKEHAAKTARLSQDSRNILLYADGSQIDGHTGAGIAGYHRGNEVITLTKGLGTGAEVYDAELWAIQKALQKATKYAVAHPTKGITNVHVYSDNNAAVQAIYDDKERAGQWLARKFRRAAEKWLAQENSRTITIGWVPGHARVKGNEKADQLAKSGCAKIESLKIETITHVRRKAKANAMLDWKDRWLDTIGHGRYAWANRFPPSWKPKTHFTDIRGNRHAYTCTFQLRLGHAHIGEYYNAFSIPEDTTCECGEPLQTREHILQHCPIHDPHRHLLHAASNHMVMTDLLGTDTGIRATTKFLIATGALSKRT